MSTAAASFGGTRDGRPSVDRVAAVLVAVAVNVLLVAWLWQPQPSGPRVVPSGQRMLLTWVERAVAMVEPPVPVSVPVTPPLPKAASPAPRPVVPLAASPTGTQESSPAAPAASTEPHDGGAYPALGDGIDAGTFAARPGLGGASLERPRVLPTFSMRDRSFAGRFSAERAARTACAELRARLRSGAPGSEDAILQSMAAQGCPP